jgi:putative NADH-flavin reductase
VSALLFLSEPNVITFDKPNFIAMKKIAVIGSTGMLGQPVTKALIEAGFQVSLLVRNEKKAKALFGSSVQLVVGDIRDTHALRELLKDKDAVYLNLSVAQASGKDDFQPEREGLASVLQIAKSSGVKRIGYLSSLVQFYQHTNWWVLCLKQQAVKSIKESGLTYSLFYPSTFMESFDKGAYRKGNTLNLAGTSHHKMFLIAGADYGKQVVKAFELDNGNHEYVVQGQEGFTADEGAKLLVENYAKAKIKVLKLPFGVLKILGLLSKKFNYAANIVDVLNNYPEKFEAGKTWEDLGKPQTKFIDYIKTA